MKRLAVYLVLFVVLGIAGCPCIDPPPPKAAARIVRCAGPEACDPDQTCDLITQACVDVCGQPCAVDQVQVQTASGACACVNTDGIGSPCLTDGDCPSVSGSPSVRQLCRAIASPEPGWPSTSVCVPEKPCEVATSQCGDPDPSIQIETTCLALVSNPPGPGTCTTTCVDSSGTERTNCRIDQVPVLVSDGPGTDTFTCSCASRRDPFGDACAVDPDCAWASGPLGNAGPTRVCKLVGSKLTCVPTDFCIKNEVKGTCGNGVDDDCDGTPDADESACQTEQCQDLDGDGWCQMMTCGVRAPALGDVAHARCRGGEFGACDAPGQAMRNPGVPEACDGVDNNCDTMLNVDEGCQRFCEDRDHDGWPRSQPQINQVAPPGEDWVQCSGTEDPSCDDADHASVHSSSPCGPVTPPSTEIPCLVLHSEPTTFLQLGATLISWSAKLEQGCPGIPDQTDVSFRNVATGGNGWCDFVLERNGQIFVTGHLSPGASRSEVIDLSAHAGATVHLSVWSPGFLGVAGSGGGAAEFRVPRSGHLTIRANCSN